MSLTILGFAKSFVAGKISADAFSSAYIELWKIERDNKILTEDAAGLSECLSSVFCVADLYNPHTDKEEYEFDEGQLRVEVLRLIEKHGL